ncbi:MAG: hypothetical protein ABIH82_00670 [Candidatus Woesearchaeota archaeon]
MVNKKELMKKGLLVGVGVAAFAKEKTDKFVNELLKKGHINKAEGQRLVKSVVDEAHKSGKKVASVLETELKKVFKAAEMKGKACTSCKSCKPKKKAVKKKVAKKKR